jgi:hypothetical protein
VFIGSSALAFILAARRRDQALDMEAPVLAMIRLVKPLNRFAAQIPPRAPKFAGSGWALQNELI